MRPASKETIMSESTVEKHDFGAEVGRLLDLVVHALYSEREIFLRELVANAADATDRRRFEALTQPTMALPEAPSVRIVPDKGARTLTITDHGIGMTHDEMMANLGTIARSGTKAFSESLQAAEAADKPSLIGQFGVGFYSAFMVADTVEVISRKAGTDTAWLWSSEGRGQFTMAPATRDDAGTTIVLHMKADADEYLEPMRIETVVRKWADNITIPVMVAGEGEAEDTKANEGTALWARSKSDVTEEQYTEFYRQVAHAWDKPWATIHWRAEGQIEFQALLFVPGMKPFDAVEGERVSKVRLHVRRMFISDSAELLPPWLRFVQGVVDTEDLPLNVSREMLQATPVLARIRKAVTNRVITELKTRAKDAEEYAKFWDNFGSVLKEGVWEDAEHRADLAGLLRFKSSTVTGLVTLAEYVERMKEGQEAIYYLAGDNADAMSRSAQLEGFRARGVEVLLLEDQIDAFWPERLDKFDDKPIRSVTQGVTDLSKLGAAEAEGEAVDTEKLITALKAALGEDVSDVRTTDRLVESAVVLAAQAGPDLQMQRLMKRAGRQSFGAAPVLEINPRHRLVAGLAARVEAGEAIDEQAHLLFDLARMQDGDMPKDPARFARGVEAALQARV
jgi:molecular chaperone HtpG